MSQLSYFKNSAPVSFGEKLAGSEQFLTLFKEGMDLVGEAAAYLDGEGREEARALARAAALAYAVESMRLTTRLMQIASWLLLQRAVNEGELTRAEAAAEKRRIRLVKSDPLSNDDVLERLPPRLREFIARSRRLQARIVHLDGLLYQSREMRAMDVSSRSPVGNQIEQLRAAFGPARMSSAAM